MRAHRQRLQRAHFAFMRALIQGLDARASWDRYLRLEGESADMRNVRRTVAWMRDAFAAAARRERRPGTARLILLDPERFASAPQLPSLEDFAREQGLEDFSHAEQIEAYEAAHPRTGARAGNGQGGRRARVVARQLEALQWLEGLAAEDPRPDDPVDAWLNPALAARLERAGLRSLRTLVECIDEAGARWWTRVPGIGAQKASRVIEWLQANENALGLRVGPHALRGRSQLAPEVLQGVVAPATALRPLEKFLLPPPLDGREGVFRAPAADCMLPARDDREAIAAWLDARAGGGSHRRDLQAALLASAAPTDTWRAYRKEAERLLLWAVLERGKALSSLAAEDAAAYRTFIDAPPATWCGPRHQQRWSVLWRPFEGPLSPAAQRQTLVILRGLFDFLVNRNYLVCNPFAPLALPPRSAAPASASASLDLASWERLDRLLGRRADDEAARAVRRALRWSRATGLRLGDVAALRCGDLRPSADSEQDLAAHDGDAWLLSIRNARGVPRQMAVPAAHIRELEEELARQGFEGRLEAPANQGIAVLARFEPRSTSPRPWSVSGLRKALKRFLHEASQGLDDAQALQLQRLSAHRLRRAAGVVS